MTSVSGVVVFSASGREYMTTCGRAKKKFFTFALWLDERVCLPGRKTHPLRLIKAQDGGSLVKVTGKLTDLAQAQSLNFAFRFQI